MMAGSDAQANVIHGPALHRELLLLSRAGLPPIEVLRAATLHPARFLSQKQDPDFGIIAAGKQADLVLLTGNPLDRVEALSEIDTVILAGVPLDRHPLQP
jgi:imidazolonepropionase-like amidohydrolase